MKKLAILLPTFNAAAYLNHSIDSILNQTYSEFDLYIYDDCSTDTTNQIISNYNDKRIFYIKNSENLGISKTLNKGLNELLPYYEYIARMDADDWCFAERLEKQVQFLDENPSLILCGTQGYWLKDINQRPVSGWEYPTSNAYIKYYLLFGATFGHSSIMLRSKGFIKFNLRYDETITTCEDWEFWIRISKIGKIANLPDFLMKYRIVETSNHRSSQNKTLHLKERSVIISNYWKTFDINLSSQQVFEYYYGSVEMSKMDFILKIKFLIEVFNQLYKNAKHNLDLGERKYFSYMLTRRVLDFKKRSRISKLNLDVWIIIIQEVRFITKIKLLKSIIR